MDVACGKQKQALFARALFPIQIQNDIKKLYEKWLLWNFLLYEYYIVQEVMFHLSSINGLLSFSRRCKDRK